MLGSALLPSDSFADAELLLLSVDAQPAVAMATASPNVATVGQTRFFALILTRFPGQVLLRGFSGELLRTGELRLGSDRR
jgi:hypothetical protein